MEKNFDRKIVFEDGSEILGYGFGAASDRVCEIVFNTSMVGYQEIISDPACTHQLVVMTYPLIGNYGIADEDFEAKVPTIGGLVVRDYNDMPSNFRYTKTLSEILEENDIPGIYGVDTRKLMCSIRDGGSKKVFITNVNTVKEDALKILASVDIPKNAVESVSCKKRWYSRTSNHKYNVVAIDCGIKNSSIKSLNMRGCNVTIVPFSTTPEEIEFMKPDGLFLSSGPGNPEDAGVVTETLKALKGKYPIFGVGLGMQLLALSYGAKTYKLPAGHGGANYPVRTLETGKLDIVTQHHSFAVCEDSLKNTGLTVTHKNIMDGSVEGVAAKEDKAFAVQFYPVGTIDPTVKVNLYDDFINLMEEAKKHA
ncbi:MAG: glutamine-hydrolyzing carbamoyl-phosphate synthase small subunit [Clostridia bacterium]|nr:glutamine-hydrolyzing carbamoyl-phosphate synthase small subunit [Clostridia bacterium]